MVKGLDRFAEAFAEFRDQYVLIGGVATVLALEDAGLEARATKDLDIVLCVEALTADFGQRMWAFVEAGGYALRERAAEPRRLYRFQHPADPTYPVMLEFFAREPSFTPLAEGAVAVRMDTTTHQTGSSQLARQPRASLGDRASLRTAGMAAPAVCARAARSASLVAATAVWPATAAKQKKRVLNLGGARTLGQDQHGPGEIGVLAERETGVGKQREMRHRGVVRKAAEIDGGIGADERARGVARTRAGPRQNPPRFS